MKAGTSYPAVFECHICRLVFSKESQLVEHAAIHGKSKTIGDESTRVGSLFPKTSEILKHEGTHNDQDCGSEEKRCYYTCKFCNLIFWEKSKYLNHRCARLLERSIKNNNRPGKATRIYKCASCKIIFPKKSDLMKHTTDHHSSHKQHTTSRQDDSNCELSEQVDLSKKNTQYSSQTENSSLRNSNSLTKKYTYQLSLPSENGDDVELFKFYKCTICKISFKLEEEFLQHQEIHCVTNDNAARIKFPTGSVQRTDPPGNLTHECLKCELVFEDQWEFAKHDIIHKNRIEKEASLEGAHFCDICKCTFSCKSDLIEHQTYSHSIQTTGSKNSQPTKDSFECNVCKLIFIQEDKLIEHKNTHTSNEKQSSRKKYECDMCKMIFDQEELIKEHLKSHRIIFKMKEARDSVIECCECKLVFTSQQDLIKHGIVHRNSGQQEKSLSSDCCDEISDSEPDSLNLESTNGNILDGNKIKENILECDSCKLMFTEKTELLQHKKIHHAFNIQSQEDHSQYPGKISPPDCDPVMARSKFSLQCDICEQIFFSESNLNRHKIVHDLSDSQIIESDAVSYECNICKLIFTADVDLQKHKVLHSQSNPDSNESPVNELECTICSVGFTQEFKLHEHRTIHHKDSHISTSTDTSHKMPQQTDADACSVDIERKTSTIEQNYVSKPRIVKLFDPKPIACRCEDCKLILTSQSELRKHEAQHQKAKKSISVKDLPRCTYKCDICHTVFKRKLEWIKHRATQCEKTVEKCDKSAKRTVPESFLKSQRRASVDSLTLEDEYVRPELPVHVNSCHKSILKSVEQFECNICNIVFKEEDKLKDHRFIHNKFSVEVNQLPECRYECTVCSDLFPTESQLIEHESDHDLGECREDDDSLYSIDNEESIVSKNNRSSPSNSMGKTSPSEIIQHDKKHQFKNVAFFKLPSEFEECDICKLMFSKESELIHHKSTVHNQENIASSKTVVCKICKMRFSEDNQLHEHVSSVHLIKCDKKSNQSSNDGYGCDMCILSFLTEEELLQHQLSHGIRAKSELVEEKETCWCEICNTEFEEEHEFIKHKESHQNISSQDSDDFQFTCDICHLGFADESTLVEHKTNHDSNGSSYTCDICEQVFIERTKLIDHFKFLKWQLVCTFTCDICDEVFVRKVEFDEHKKVHAELDSSLPVTFTCSTCKQVFLSESELTEHRAIHNEKKQFVCGICCKPFVRKAYLNIHFKRHINEKKLCAYRLSPQTFSQEPENKQIIELQKTDVKRKLENEMTASSKISKMENEGFLECVNCSQVFSEQSQLIEHRREQHDEETYQCGICLMTFNDKYVLDEHINDYIDEKPVSCQVCQRTFHIASQLDNHMKDHADKKFVECELCQQKFTKRSNMVRHMLIHTGIRDFECEICHMKFHYKANMKTHMKLHTGVKPYECKTCHKRFARKAHVEDHEKVHSGERNYACGLCDQRFIQKNGLNRHQKIYHGNKQYTCQLCHKGFVMRSHLTEHYRIHIVENPERSFVCLVCGEAFEHYNWTHRHMRVHAEKEVR